MKVLNEIEMYLFLQGTLLMLVHYDSDRDAEDIPDEKPKVIEITPFRGMDLYGVINDSDGNLPKGLMEGDGHTFALSNEKGVYQIKKMKMQNLFFYYTPYSYRIVKKSSSDNVASFFSKIGTNEK